LSCVSAFETSERIEERKISGRDWHKGLRRSCTALVFERTLAWLKTLKNRIFLENYYRPVDQETKIAAFVEAYNYRRYHESLNNLTPADVYFGRAPKILHEREGIKRLSNQNVACHTN
jgi:transposase InsO family protein